MVKIAVAWMVIVLLFVVLNAFIMMSINPCGIITESFKIKYFKFLEKVGEWRR